MPPPLPAAELLEKVELETVTVPELVLRMPPPGLDAVFLSSVELVTLRLPPLL